MSFKVGDQVIIVSVTSGAPQSTIGKVGKVTTVDTDEIPYLVKFEANVIEDYDECDWWYSFNDLKLHNPDQLDANQPNEDLAAFKARVYKVGKKAAIENSWCEVFDELMDELGIEAPEVPEPADGAIVVKPIGGSTSILRRVGNDWGRYDSLGYEHMASWKAVLDFIGSNWRGSYKVLSSGEVFQL